MGYQEEFLHAKCGQALEQAAQRGAGVTIPGGDPQQCRRGTEGCGQWGAAATDVKGENTPL